MSTETQVKWVSDNDSSYHGTMDGGYTLEVSRYLQGDWHWWAWHGAEIIGRGKHPTNPRNSGIAKWLAILAAQNHKKIKI